MSARPRRRPQAKPRVVADPEAPLALAIDTSGAVEALAVVQGDLVLADQRIRRPRRRGTALGVAIQQLLASCDRAPSDLAALTVGIGPGAFTGLRVGLATAHGLATALRIPLYGFDSTLGPACAVGRPGRPVAVVLDARRDEVYSAVYDLDGDGLPTVVRATTLESPAALHGALPDDALLVGDGARLYANALTAGKPSRTVGVLQPEGPSLAPLAADALRRLAAGESPPLATVQPVYLRDHDGVRKPPNRDS